MKLYGGKGGKKSMRPKRHSKPGKKRAIRKLVVFLLILAAIALTVTALALKYVRPPQASTHDGKDTEVIVKPIENELTNGRKKDFFTVLVVGTDYESWNTDTILLCSYDVAQNKINVMSIPRDTMVNVTRSNKKINSAYTVGGQAGNIEELLSEVESVVGFKPDSHVVVSLKGFIEIIDAVGGVSVDVPVNMKYNDPAQELKIDIPKGMQHLDGYDAMCFMRFRSTYAEGDIGRIRVQHLLIEALAKKILSADSIKQLPELVGLVMEHVKTDLNAGNLIWMGQKALSMEKMPEIETCMLPGVGEYYKGVSYFMVDEEKAIEKINETVCPYKEGITDLNILDVE